MASNLDPVVDLIQHLLSLHAIFRLVLPYLNFILHYLSWVVVALILGQLLKLVAILVPGETRQFMHTKEPQLLGYHLAVPLASNQTP